jgi:hypothetical protein
LTDGLQQAARPGWYEDPGATDLLRWWDGAQWSDQEFRPKLLGDFQSNHIAKRARVLFFWAVGVVLLFWLVPIAMTFVPSAEIQTVGIILAWIGFLPASTLTVLAIVFGAIGLSRASKMEGRGRTSALIGLIGGIGLIVAPGLIVLVGVGLTIAASSL